MTGVLTSVALFEGWATLCRTPRISLRSIRGYLPPPASQAPFQPYLLWLPYRIYHVLRTNTLVPRYAC